MKNYVCILINVWRGVNQRGCLIQLLFWCSIACVNRRGSLHRENIVRVFCYIFGKVSFVYWTKNWNFSLLNIVLHPIKSFHKDKKNQIAQQTGMKKLEIFPHEMVGQMLLFFLAEKYLIIWLNLSSLHQSILIVLFDKVRYLFFQERFYLYKKYTHTSTTLYFKSISM